MSSEKVKKKRPIDLIILFVITATILLIYVSSLILKSNNLVFIYENTYTYLLAASIVSFFILFIMVIKKSIKNNRIKKTIYIISSIVFIAFMNLFLLYTSFSFSTSAPRKFYSSPSGNNKIVIFEGVWIDEVYSAYAVKWGIFYEYKENSKLAEHAFWIDSKRDIKVEWLSENEAKSTNGF